ncbi:MAG: peptidylprolyl isomerase [Thermomicrobiales bacterium]
MRKSIVRVAGAYLAAGALTAVLVACGAGPRPTVTPTRGAAVPAASAASASTGAGAAASVPSASKKTYSAAPAMSIDQNKSYTALIKTSMGDITVALNAKDAPLTVNNFVFLARDHFYDGLTFHRIIKGFMIQGGDPNGTGTGGPGYKFPDEPVKGKYEIGSIAMANSGPNTNGSQFFICEGQNCTTLPPQYNLFGKVSAGQDVVSKIGSVQTGANDRPVQPVTIISITITEQ